MRGKRSATPDLCRAEAAMASNASSNTWAASTERPVRPYAESVVRVEVRAAAVTGMRIEHHRVDRPGIDLPLPPRAALASRSVARFPRLEHEALDAAAPGFAPQARQRFPVRRRRAPRGARAARATTMRADRRLRFRGNRRRESAPARFRGLRASASCGRCAAAIARTAARPRASRPARRRARRTSCARMPSHFHSASHSSIAPRAEGSPSRGEARKNG